MLCRYGTGGSCVIFRKQIHLNLCSSVSVKRVSLCDVARLLLKFSELYRNFLINLDFIHEIVLFLRKR